MRLILPATKALPAFVFGFYLRQNKRLAMRMIARAFWLQVRWDDYSETRRLERWLLFPFEMTNMLGTILPLIHDMEKMVKEKN